MPTPLKDPYPFLPAAQGSRGEEGAGCSQECMLPAVGTSTHRRSSRCSTNPPGGRRAGSGPGGSWGPPLPHTGLGHTLGKRQNLGAAWPHRGPRSGSALISSQNPDPRPQSCLRCRAAPSPRWSAPHSPCPGPLTTAVAGAAGVLLEVGEESVAWAAGRGETLAHSLVTHWPRSHKACHLEAGTSPSSQHCPFPGHLVLIMASSPHVLGRASEGHTEDPGLGQKGSKS